MPVGRLNRKNLSPGSDKPLVTLTCNQLLFRFVIRDGTIDILGSK